MGSDKIFRLRLRLITKNRRVVNRPETSSVDQSFPGFQSAFSIVGFRHGDNYIGFIVDNHRNIS